MELLTLAPGSDRIPVELFQILKDDAVESAALNMQYAGSRQLCIGTYMQPAGMTTCSLCVRARTHNVYESLAVEQCNRPPLLRMT